MRLCFGFTSIGGFLVKPIDELGPAADTGDYGYSAGHSIPGEMPNAELLYGTWKFPEVGL